MLRSAVGLISASARVFLEAAPEGLSPQQIGEALVAAPGVVEVHDLHVWEVTSGFSALSAHVLVAREADCHAARRGLEALLHDRFGVEHTTLQVDHEGAELIGLEVSPRGRTGRGRLSPSGLCDACAGAARSCERERVPGRLGEDDLRADLEGR